MKKTATIFYLFLFFYCINVQGQESNTPTIEKKSNYFKIEFAAVGASIDLSTSKSLVNANLLSSRADMGIATTFFRVTHLFSDKIGWYAAMDMNLFKERKSPYYQAAFGDVVGDFGLSLFYGGFIPSPQIDAGIVYRIESKRWDINPRMGFGYGIILLDRDSEKIQSLTDGTIERTVYKQKSASTLLNLGVAAHYFFGKRSFIALNASFKQPLAKSSATLTLFKDDISSEYQKYSSASVGRDINLTVGYGILLGKRKVSL